MIEVRLAQIERFAADELHARRVGRDREGEGVLVRVRRSCTTVEGKTMISSASGALVASIRQPRMTTPSLFVVDDPGGQVRVGLLVDALRAVRLRVDQRMRQAEIVLADVLVVVADVLAEARIVGGEIVRRGGHRHEGTEFT